jgi:hypothetical protein
MSAEEHTLFFALLLDVLSSSSDNRFVRLIFMLPIFVLSLFHDIQMFSICRFTRMSMASWKWLR